MNEKTILQEQLYNSLKLMINWTFLIQEEFNSANYTPLMWAKEICSIKFSLPRQSGHTYMIKKLCTDTIKFNVPIKPIILLPSYEQALKAEFDPKCAWVGSPNNLDQFYGICPNMVICDISSMMSKSNIEKIYKMFSELSTKNPFVFLFME